MKLAIRAVLSASLLSGATLAQAQAYGPPITLEQAKKVMAGAEAEALQDALAKGAADWRYLTFPRMIAADGGHPIVIDGKIAGAIGVSGATGPDDSRVGQAGIEALK